MKKEQKELLVKIKNLVSLEQRTTAEILKSLCLVEKDKLYIGLGYSSLFKYLCEELGHSEGEATRRINTCRMMKEFPQIEEKVKRGELNLTNLSRAAQVLKQTNLDQKQKLETLKKIEKKSTRQAEQILFEISDLKLNAKETERRVSKDKKSLTLIFTDEELSHIEKLKGRWNRAKNLSTKELIMGLVAKELQKTEKVTTAVARSKATNRLTRGLVAAQVLKRAQHKCEVKNCGETRFLQIHHLKPYSQGGLTQISNLELLCHNHHTHADQRSFR
jgi:hypothetical protein